MPVSFLLWALAGTLTAYEPASVIFPRDNSPTAAQLFSQLVEKCSLNARKVGSAPSASCRQFIESLAETQADPDTGLSKDAEGLTEGNAPSHAEHKREKAKVPFKVVNVEVLENNAVSTRQHIPPLPFAPAFALLTSSQNLALTGRINAYCQRDSARCGGTGRFQACLKRPWLKRRKSFMSSFPLLLVQTPGGSRYIWWPHQYIIKGEHGLYCYAFMPRDSLNARAPWGAHKLGQAQGGGPRPPRKVDQAKRKKMLALFLFALGLLSIGAAAFIFLKRSHPAVYRELIVA